MQQRLIQEEKEREKTEALLEQQKQFAAENEAEASSRELELKKALELLRAHAAAELSDTKFFLQQQLTTCNASLRAAEDELAVIGQKNCVARTHTLTHTHTRTHAHTHTHTHTHTRIHTHTHTHAGGARICAVAARAGGAGAGVVSVSSRQG